MPFGPFRGAVPENDIVVSDYIEDFMVAIDKRRKAQTTASKKGQRIASGGRPRQPQARKGDCRRAKTSQTPESTKAEKGSASPERDLEQTPESKKGQRIASDCGRASASQTPESTERADCWREAKRQKGDGCAPGSSGVQERSEGSTPTFDFRDSSPVDDQDSQWFDSQLP